VIANKLRLCFHASNKQNEAATSFQVAIQRRRDQNLMDLAAGAWGSYRYLIRMFDPIQQTRIQRVGLLRGPKANGDIISKKSDYGWDKCTSNINEGRNGDYLYLCWKKIEV